MILSTSYYVRLNVPEALDALLAHLLGHIPTHFADAGRVIRAFTNPSDLRNLLGPQSLTLPLSTFREMFGVGGGRMLWPDPGTSIPLQDGWRLSADVEVSRDDVTGYDRATVLYHIEN